MNIFLIGYRGSGKTSVAQALAEELGWPWIDADAELERRAGKSIKEVFESGGEPEFRDLESAVVTDLAQLDRHIIALGGGAILRQANRTALAGRGKFIWLQASPEVLLTRIQGDATTAARRPNLTGQGGLAEIRSLLEARTPVYAACADVTINGEQRSPAEIAQQIISELSLEG